jgi:hypothetical protein
VGNRIPTDGFDSTGPIDPNRGGPVEAAKFDANVRSNEEIQKAIDARHDHPRVIEGKLKHSR